MGSAYLERVRIDHFGAWSNRTIGPFTPHLNVVFGPNEAGKTTFSSFVDGVLFGWPDARGSRNTYKPDDAERSGSLFFACKPETEDSATDADEARNTRSTANTNADLELRRVRNADGLKGDKTIVQDIDQDTYRTVFSLTSDELLSLRDTSNITSRLLTAGSGTVVSPASVLSSLDEQLAEFTSRSQGAEHSIVRLDDEEKKLRENTADALDEAQRYRDQEKELQELEPKSQSARERENEMNATIRSLSSCRAGLEKINSEMVSLESSITRSLNEARQAEAERLTCEQNCESGLASLSGAQDRSMREKIDDLIERETKQTHLCDTARDRANEASAYYEALIEMQDAESEDSHRRMWAKNRRRHRIALTIAATVMFVLLLFLGVLLFVRGSSAGTLAWSALGVVFIVAGFAIAVAIIVAFFRGNRKDEDFEQQLGQAQQAAIQEKKKLEACEADAQKLKGDIEDELKNMGLGAASSSLRRARDLLEEAKDLRKDMAVSREKEQAARKNVQEATERKDELTRQKTLLCEQAGVSPETTLAELDRRITLLSQQHAELHEENEKTSQRLGELKHDLSQAKSMHEFDRLKNRAQEIKTRKAEATRDFARLLLARHMLECAIASWESKSQPEVYEQAGRLLALMTDGRWTRIERLENDTFQISDEAHNTLLTNKLSMGTRQQLYLALRIALLMCADDVGRAIPIIADDILVNFDATRRAGAACALAQLAQTRQVIVLTCHEEIVEVMRAADENVQVIEL